MHLRALMPLWLLSFVRDMKTTIRLHSTGYRGGALPKGTLPNFMSLAMRFWLCFHLLAITM
jgi:hypothetical protein